MEETGLQDDVGVDDMVYASKLDSCVNMKHNNSSTPPPLD